MAQIKPEWEIVKEAEQLVARFCELYPEKFGHIQPDTIGCAMITNKDRPDSADYDFKIKGVREPEALYSSKQYVVWFYKNIWDSYNKKQKAFVLFRALMSIPEDPDGSVVKEDLKDWRCLIKIFGIDYMDNPNVPDLSETKQTI